MYEMGRLTPIQAHPPFAEKVLVQGGRCTACRQEGRKEGRSLSRLRRWGADWFGLPPFGCLRGARGTRRMQRHKPTSVGAFRSNPVRDKRATRAKYTGPPNFIGGHAKEKEKRGEGIIVQNGPAASSPRRVTLPPCHAIWGVLRQGYFARVPRLAGGAQGGRSSGVRADGKCCPFFFPVRPELQLRA